MKKQLAIGAVVCVLLCALAIAGSAETPAGIRDGQVILVAEPEDTPADLTAYHGGQPVAPGDLTWTDGVHGQAIRLDGQSDYLEYTGSAVRAGALSGAAWVYWQGSVSDDAAGEIGQRLWTLYRDEDNYFSVCLRMTRDNVRDRETGAVGRMDGVYMEYRLAGVMGRLVDDYDLVPTAQTFDYAIPQNTWTHLAFTLNENTMRLYINGRLWFEEDLSGVAALDAAYLRIGGAVSDGPTLNALLDDAALFTQTLDAESIRTLAQGAALDFTGATEATVYRPTKPTDSADEEEEDAALRIPDFAWIVMGAVAAVFVIAIIAVNTRSKEDDA